MSSPSSPWLGSSRRPSDVRWYRITAAARSSTSRGRIVLALGLTFLALLGVLSCRRSSPYPWEADPLYRAIRTFDPGAYAQMQGKVHSVKRAGAVGERDVDEALAPLVRNVKRHALRSAPDEVVVAYVRSEVEVADLLAASQPEACIEILEAGRLVLEGPDGGVGLELPDTACRIAKAMDTKAIASARLPGPRTPAFTVEQTSVFVARYFEDDEGDGAMDPKASAQTRCQGDLGRFRRLLGVSDPELVRVLRMLVVRND